MCWCNYWPMEGVCLSQSRRLHFDWIRSSYRQWNFPNDDLNLWHVPVWLAYSKTMWPLEWNIHKIKMPWHIVQAVINAIGGEDGILLLMYGLFVIWNWICHVCRSRKCKVANPPDLCKKRKTCCLLCLWYRVQEDTSGTGKSLNYTSSMYLHYVKWNLDAVFPSRAETV